MPGHSNLVVSQGRDNKIVRSDGNVEVVFLHSWPSELYSELIASFCLKGCSGCFAGYASICKSSCRQTSLAREARNRNLWVHCDRPPLLTGLCFIVQICRLSGACAKMQSHDDLGNVGLRSE